MQWLTNSITIRHPQSPTFVVDTTANMTAINTAAARMTGIDAIPRTSNDDKSKGHVRIDHKFVYEGALDYDTPINFQRPFSSLTSGPGNTISI